MPRYLPNRLTAKPQPEHSRRGVALGLQTVGALWVQSLGRQHHHGAGFEPPQTWIPARVLQQLAIHRSAARGSVEYNRFGGTQHDIIYSQLGAADSGTGPMVWLTARAWGDPRLPASTNAGPALSLFGGEKCGDRPSPGSTA